MDEQPWFLTGNAIHLVEDMSKSPDSIIELDSYCGRNKPGKNANRVGIGNMPDGASVCDKCQQGLNGELDDDSGEDVRDISTSETNKNSEPSSYSFYANN